MKRICVFLSILAMSFGILGLHVSPSHALYPYERYDTINITSVNPADFTGVAGSITTGQNWRGNPGESYTQNFTTSWVALYTSWTATGMTVSNISLSNTASATFTMNQGTYSGTSLLTRSIPSGAVPPLSIDNGRYYIEGLWSGWGGAYNSNNDGYFEFTAILPGDWSKEGNQYMGHTATWNSLWTIDQDFAYAGGVTTFKAHLDGYDSDRSQDLGLNVRLYGGLAPVPEPASLLLVGLGLIGVAGMRRFRK